MSSGSWFDEDINPGNIIMLTTLKERFKRWKYYFIHSKFLRRYRSICNLIYDEFYTKKVSCYVYNEVISAFLEYFRGWCDDDYNMVVHPTSTIPMEHLMITDLKVFRYRGKLVLEIHTDRPGICIGKGGCFVNSYREYIRKSIHDPEFEIHFKESFIFDLKYNY